ncbi:MAG: membrane protein insertion efficiency factor YidD [Rhodospirillales bacterium]|nr:membrane protein insertion efficiency factor YidD [Rhodospirillales bacterium]
MTLARKLLKGMVRGYQLLISPVLPGSCRFEPTCSEYALQSIDRFGPVKGLWLAIKRFLRCHPWGGAFYDPVPETKEEKPAGGCSLHGHSV